MRISIFALTAFLAFLFVACGGSNDPNEKLRKEKFKEVIALHDEVMPIWGNMPTLRKKLGKIQKKMAENPEKYAPEDKDKTAVLIEDIEKIREDLKKGHDGMRNWMKSISNFYDKPKDMTHENYLLGLEEERGKMVEVKALMESSTQAATAMIENLDN